MTELENILIDRLETVSTITDGLIAVEEIKAEHEDTLTDKQINNLNLFTLPVLRAMNSIIGEALNETFRHLTEEKA